MRGVLYRTEADGETPLAKPELKVSATKHNRVAYYENEDVKNEAFEAGDLKEGMIVMTAEDDLSQVSSVPVATIIASASDAAPSGYLLCDGNQYSQTQYPALYLAIGNKYNKEDTSDGYFCVPDLRELVLVGSGQNEKEAIENHDVFELGEFKDDQLQDHTHDVSTGWVQTTSGSQSGVLGTYGSGFTRWTASTITNGRSGDNTRTKQFGVNYFIKAISGELVQDDGVTVNNIMKNIYPDWSKALPMTYTSGSWTAPVDCWVFTGITQTGGTSNSFYVDNKVLFTTTTNAPTIPFQSTIRAGTVIRNSSPFSSSYYIPNV